MPNSEIRVEPVAFSGNNAALWGTTIEGLPVLSPSEAARRFGSPAVFVITIWGYGSSDAMRSRQQIWSAARFRPPDIYEEQGFYEHP